MKPELQTLERPMEEASLLDALAPLARRWKMVAGGSVAAGVLAIGITFLLSPVFTARTAFLPPQQQGSSAAALASSLGALAGLAGGATPGGLRTPGDQYVALLQSTTIADRLIDRFHLMQVYDKSYRVDARKVLGENTRISLGKKDGVISLEVDDEDPRRSADIANRYVDELRALTSRLAITEAQQRRVFFEQQMKQTRDRLTEAQRALEGSGIGAGALKAEPRAAAETYARLRAEAAAAEVKLQMLQRSLSSAAPEVVQQSTLLAGLRQQLAEAEAASSQPAGADYVSRYREFKYQETLFELFARQYEAARADEAREGALIQVFDVAEPPEKKSRPKRLLIGIVVTLASAVILSIWTLVQGALASARERRRAAR